MRVNLIIDSDMPEGEAEIKVRHLTAEISQVMQQLSAVDFRLVGVRDDKSYQLLPSHVTTIYASEKKVFGLTDGKMEYQLSQTLSALTEKLPSNFLRISKGEIVNANKITSFDFTFGGKMKITFANGCYTYSSRSYLKKIKEYFGL